MYQKDSIQARYKNGTTLGHSFFELLPSRWISPNFSLSRYSHHSRFNFHGEKVSLRWGARLGADHYWDWQSLLCDASHGGGSVPKGSLWGCNQKEGTWAMLWEKARSNYHKWNELQSLWYFCVSQQGIGKWQLYLPGYEWSKNVRKKVHCIRQSLT